MFFNCYGCYRTFCESVCTNIEYNEKSFSFYLFLPYAAFYFFVRIITEEVGCKASVSVGQAYIIYYDWLRAEVLYLWNQVIISSGSGIPVVWRYRNSMVYVCHGCFYAYDVFAAGITAVVCYANQNYGCMPCWIWYEYWKLSLSFKDYCIFSFLLCRKSFEYKESAGGFR